MLVGGPPVTIFTDQQPLVSLWTSKRKSPFRIERILLRHQDVNHQVIWSKGKESPADYTSRHAIPIDNLPQHIHGEAKEHQKLLFLLHQPIQSTISLQRLHQAQRNDRQIERLRHFIAFDLPPYNDPTSKGYHKIFSELSIGADDIIYRGDRILLPQSLYDEVISIAHSGSHAGQDDVKRRIRAHFWFPSLDNIVQQHLQTCLECQIHTRSTTKVPLSSAPTPHHPWESVSLDLFGPLPDISHILVSRCNLSRFPDAKVVHSTGTRHVLPVLATIYNNFGNPREHKADNGPPFNSQEFKDFSAAGGIIVKHSYPYHPQGNEAECFMTPLGKAIEVAFDTNKPVAIDELLTDYRSTPHPATGLTPGDMVFRGGYHSKLPKKTPPAYSQIEEAKGRDKEWKTKVIAIKNASRWRKYPNIILGEDVLVMRSQTRGKFHSLYEPTPCTVIDVKCARYKLLSCDTRRSRQPIFRHASQIKLYHEPVPINLQQTKPPSVQLPHPDATIEIPCTRRKFQDQPIQPSRDSLSDQAQNSPGNKGDQPPQEENAREREISLSPSPDAIEPQITFCQPEQETVDIERRRTVKQKKVK